MTQEHPNVLLMKQLNILNLDSCAHLFDPNFVWHYINPNLPDVEGDYKGLVGLQSFFQAIHSKTNGSFEVRPISVNAFGDELVVMHVRNTMSLEDEPIHVDAIVVWRFVKGRIAEAWDIPSAHTLADAA